MMSTAKVAMASLIELVHSRLRVILLGSLLELLLELRGHTCRLLFLLEVLDRVITRFLLLQFLLRELLSLFGI